MSPLSLYPRHFGCCLLPGLFCRWLRWWYRRFDPPTVLFAGSSSPPARVSALLRPLVGLRGAAILRSTLECPEPVLHLYRIEAELDGTVLLDVFLDRCGTLCILTICSHPRGASHLFVLIAELSQVALNSTSSAVQAERSALFLTDLHCVSTVWLSTVSAATTTVARAAVRLSAGCCLLLLVRGASHSCYCGCCT